ncbi:MAG TPA: hypothetical protein PLV55_10300 [Anaerohalosphaeraceae bacterium]|nr:hypothetical protein [Anaerohalosphaeraceae bacterium]
MSETVKQPRFMQEAVPLSQGLGGGVQGRVFDPDGDGYDFVHTGRESGPLLDEQTGMILVGRRHPDFMKVVREEEAKGRDIVRTSTGRYFSVQIPRFVKEAVSLDLPSRLDDVDEYDYAEEKQVPLGVLGVLRRNLYEKLGWHIPLVGLVLEASDTAKVRAAIERLQGGFDYDGYLENLYRQAYAETEGALPSNLPVITREGDERLVREYYEYVGREMTTGGKIADVLVKSTQFWMEFFLTAGAAKSASAGAKAAMRAAMKKASETAAGKIALHTAGFAAGLAARSTLLASHTLANYQHRRLDVETMRRTEESPYRSILMSHLDTIFTVLSESSGEGMTYLAKKGAGFLGKLPFLGKILPKLESEWIRLTGGTRAQFAKEILSKAGFSNVLAEVGEERLETILDATFGVEDYGLGRDSTVLERIQAGLIKDMENIWIELAAFSIPQMMHTAAALTEYKSPLLEPEIKTGEVPVQTQQELEKKEAAEAKAEREPAKKTAPALTEEKPQVPLTEEIESANTAAEVDNVIRSIVSDGSSPIALSIRKEDIQDYRKLLGLTVPSSTSRSWLQAMREAVRQNIIPRAMEIASSLTANPRPITDIETAGLGMRLVQIEANRRLLARKLAETEDEAEIAGYEARLNQLENEFDVITTGLLKAKSEIGRALAIQKATITEQYDIFSVKARAKRVKGKDLTPDESEELERLTRELEEKNEKIRQLEMEIEMLYAAKEAAAKQKGGGRSRRGIILPYTEMSTKKLDAEIFTLKGEIAVLLKEGCI